MEFPAWFSLIKQWRDQDYGDHGITPPFLVGALATYKDNIHDIDINYVQGIMDEMRNHPVPGYVVEVQWCPNIDAIILRIADSARPKSIPESSVAPHDSDSPSILFSQNAHSTITANGLGCVTGEDCFAKLVHYALKYSQDGRFSKNRGEYGPFIKKDIEFIRSVLQIDY